MAGKPELIANPTGRKWFEMIRSGNGAEAAIEIITAFSQGTFPRELIYAPRSRPYRGAWKHFLCPLLREHSAGEGTMLLVPATRIAMWRRSPAEVIAPVKEIVA